MSTNPRDTRRRHLPGHGLTIKRAVEALQMIGMRVPEFSVLHLLPDVFELHHLDFLPSNSWNEDEN